MNSPLWVDGQLNAKPVVRLTRAASHYFTHPSMTLRTIFLVGKSSGATFSTYDGIFGASPGSHVLSAWSGTTGFNQGGATLTYARKNGVGISFSSVHSFAPINEYWIGSFESPTAITQAGWFGQISGGGRYWDGDFAEVLVYSTTLSVAERGAVESYLQIKYGFANPTNSTISVTGAAADGSDNATVTLTLKDSNNTAMAGATPIVSITGSGNTVNACTSSNSSGVSTCAITSTVAQLKSVSITSPASLSRLSDYKATVLADSPTAYWRLGETSGTSATDLSGNAHGHVCG